MSLAVGSVGLSPLSGKPQANGSRILQFCDKARPDLNLAIAVPVLRVRGSKDFAGRRSRQS